MLPIKLSFFILLLSLSSVGYFQEVNDFSFINNMRQKRVDYPVRFTYINRITKWWPPSSTLAQMAVPDYAQPHAYNYAALSFWTCEKGPIDVSKTWEDPIKFFGQQLGKTKIEVQNFLKRKYNKGGVSIILSAFGAAQYPTTKGLDPIVCAKKLGEYVNSNNYDGVDVDYEDNEAMKRGTGEEWVIKFMLQLRRIIPYHIISHAPQAPYFNSGYIKGGYRRIHRQVGHLIDFYNLQYYNQMNSTYNNYQHLFLKSDINSPQSSILQLNKVVGIPLEMLVVGKPASLQDVYNTGYTKPSDLMEFFVKASRQIRWSTGFMFWQYHSDKSGTLANELTHVLKSLSSK